MRSYQSEAQSVRAFSAHRKRAERGGRALKGFRVRDLIDPERVVEDERLDRCRDKKNPKGRTGKKPCEQSDVEDCQSVLPFEHTVLPRG